VRPGLVQDFIEQFTYVGIFLVLFIAGLGVPIPEEVPILSAGVLAHQEIVRWWVALPVCLAGVLSADVALYWVGHHWGEHILDWRWTRLVLSREREERLKAAYHRHGVKIIFMARHVVGLRAAVFLTAGIVRIPFWSFLIADVGAAAIGVPLGFGLAFFFTDTLQTLIADIHRLERWLALVVVMGAALWLAWSTWRHARRDVLK
jgi:membrane protein DedA with SNARE-associated domain